MPETNSSLQQPHKTSGGWPNSGHDTESLPLESGIDRYLALRRGGRGEHAGQRQKWADEQTVRRVFQRNRPIADFTGIQHRSSERDLLALGFLMQVDEASGATSLKNAFARHDPEAHQASSRRCTSGCGAMAATMPLRSRCPRATVTCSRRRIPSRWRMSSTTLCASTSE